MAYKKENVWPMVGAWAFVIGILVAMAAGVLAPYSATVALVLGVIGLIIGLVNVTGSETVEFLVAAIAFTVAANSFSAVLTGLPGAQLAGNVIPAILSYFVAVIAPAAAVVSLKALYEVARVA